MPLGPSGRRADRAALEAGGCQGRTRHGQAEEPPVDGRSAAPPVQVVISRVCHLEAAAAPAAG